METKQKRTKVKVSVLALAVLVLFTLSGPAWAQEGMISYWRFDEGSGNIAGDCVNGNHGTIYGAQWTTGIVNGALSFDGIDDYIAVDIVSINTHTLEAWICRKDGSTGGIIGFESGGTFTYTIGVDKNGNDKLFYYVWSGSHPVHFLYSSSVIPINDWVHIAVTRDDSTGISKMYINGQYETTMTCGGDSAPHFSIGRTRWYDGGYYTSYFNGFIDEAAIYNRALSLEEIAQHYENGLNGQGYQIPMIANAGPDQTVEQDSYAGASVTLDGSGSSDPEGDPLTYSWTWDGGSASGVSPTIVLPLGTKTITLVVNDGTSDSEPDTVDITVDDTTPPVITLNGDATITLECGIDEYEEPGATVLDNCDQTVSVVIAGDTVDTSICGTYIVTYNATDVSGNAAAEVTRTVVVQDTIPPEITIVAPEAYGLYPEGGLELDFSATDDVGVTELNTDFRRALSVI